MSSPITPEIKQPSPSISAGVNAAVARNVPKGIGTVPMDDSFPDKLHCLVYGYTSAYKTTTAAKFGGPERTLIITTRDPEQIRIPLRGMGFKPLVTAYDSESVIWALTHPETAADRVGFPEWKDHPERVLMFDDWTEGAALLVEDNSYKDDGKEVKDGRKIYGETKNDMRAILNALKARHIHTVFTALAAETDWNIYPDLPKGARTHLEAAFDYVFYCKKDVKKLITDDFSIPYPAKDGVTGKDITRLRNGFAKTKIPNGYIGKQPPLLGKEEPLDLRVIWEKIQAARGGK